MMYEFLRRGFVATSIDHRLIPEINLDKQLDDIQSAQTWVREDLPKEAVKFGIKVNPNQVLVRGASAGGYLVTMVACIETLAPRVRRAC